MNLDVSEIKFSRNDLKREIRLPEKLTLKLAEDIGIMTGDGYVSLCIRGTTKDYETGIAGHSITDKLYLKQFVNPLKEYLFNIKYKYLEKDSNTYVLRLRSCAVMTFYHEIVGLPLGSKQKISVPNIIMTSNNNIKKAFLRGLD
ncbi:MAG: hypothetical protein KKC05_02660, partial [Nanoarchaeota archaeon]|nr:hypothetical protein [Nanoarchaeota archaeon]